MIVLWVSPAYMLFGVDDTSESFKKITETGKLGAELLRIIVER